MMRSLCLVYLAEVVLTIIVVRTVASAEQATPLAAEPLEAVINQLINQLGDSQYSVRERAEKELRRLGTAAFDPILVAQDHADVEIASRARYLIRSMPIEWASDTDLPEVRSQLTNFDQLTSSQRTERSQALSKLPADAGIPALCRIVRFDEDRVVSKQAALLIMAMKSPEDAAARQQRAASIRRGLALSKRPAIEWLLTYARELDAPGSTVADWSRITRDELALWAKSPQHTNREVVRDLLRRQALLLLDQHREEEALVAAQKTMDLIEDNLVDIHEAIDWSIEHRLFRLPDEIADHFGTTVQQHTYLQYRVAEAQLKRGDRSKADATVQLAFNATRDDEQRMAVARQLQHRMLYDWAEAEYRRVAQNEKPESITNILARWRLSDMLADLERDHAAAEILAPLAALAIKTPDAITAALGLEFGQDADSVVGYYHFRQAGYFARASDRDKQIEHLQKAIQHQPDNVDFIIAMDRVPDPNANWKAAVQDRIDSHVGKCRTKIRELEQDRLAGPVNAERDFELANGCNDLAWLVSNTRGDYAEAVRASHRSLELSPENPAFLDTLGRCYFAAQDFENAVKYQRQAVAATPQVQVMQRQLKLFEEALKNKK